MKKKPTSKPNSAKATLNSPLAQIRKVIVKLPGGKIKVIEKVKGFQI